MERSSRAASDSISALRSLRLAVFAIRRAEICVMVSTTSSPFSRSVAPVSTISTMPSARPSSGASSTEPSILMIRTSMARLSKNWRAMFGYLVATVFAL